jgi:hypothetical protein
VRIRVEHRALCIVVTPWPGTAPAVSAVSSHRSPLNDDKKMSLRSFLTLNKWRYDINVG